MKKAELLKTAKPILFNTDMVQAILEGKSVSRRAVKGYIPKDAVFGYTGFTPNRHISCRGTFEDGYGEKFFKLRYQKGDILYVRETYVPNYFDKYVAGYRGDGLRGNSNAYKADYHKNIIGDVVPEPKWVPSIHMPKEAARIFLKVTDVRVERLQAMTLDDFLNEGAVIRPEAFNDPDNAYLQARDVFVKTWDSTVKKEEIYLYGWDGNPWVWVIEFEQVL